MTHGQAGVVCPQCGSAAAVHSIAEWAAMARGQQGGQLPGYGPGPQPGYGPPQPGYPAAPGPAAPGPAAQTGFPDPSQYRQTGFPDPSQYQQTGFPEPSQYQQTGSPGPSQPAPPADQAEPWPSQQPGHAGGPGPQAGFPGPGQGQQPGFPADPWQSQPPPRRSSGWEGTGYDVSLGDGIADAVLDSATKFIGRAIGRRVRRTLDERVLSAMAARQQEMLRARMAIAERHPDLCACLNDQVIFLAGGSRVLPLASASGVLTVEQSDALVARLR